MISTAELQITPVVTMPVAAHSGHELVALRVEPSSERELAYDVDGWPAGYDPPPGLREHGRADASAPIGPDIVVDPCHGYPWPIRWSQARLAAVVPGLDEDAYRCLRRRLKHERAWDEHELRGRVDNLRG